MLSYACFREDAYREIRQMMDLGSHAHLTSLIGYVDGALPLIVMEYCAKGDLLKYLRAHLETCKEAVYSVS